MFGRAGGRIGSVDLESGGSMPEHERTPRSEHLALDAGGNPRPSRIVRGLGLSIRGARSNPGRRSRRPAGIASTPAVITTAPPTKVRRKASLRARMTSLPGPRFLAGLTSAGLRKPADETGGERWIRTISMDFHTGSLHGSQDPIVR